MFVTANTDDINLHGTLSAIEAACAAKEALQKDPNYVVNLSKQRIYLPNPAHLDEVQRAFPGHTITTPENGGGIKIGGTPLGSIAYLRSIMQANIDKTAKAIDAIMLLPSKQQQLLMLRSCIPGRIPHLLNAVDPMISREYAIQHDTLIQTALATVFELNDAFTEREKLQLQRKLSDHGLGFCSMEHSVASSSCLGLRGRCTYSTKTTTPWGKTMLCGNQLPGLCEQSKVMGQSWRAR